MGREEAPMRTLTVIAHDGKKADRLPATHTAAAGWASAD
jgi:hypothetical protein